MLTSDWPRLQSSGPGPRAPGRALGPGFGPGPRTNIECYVPVARQAGNPNFVILPKYYFGILRICWTSKRLLTRGAFSPLCLPLPLSFLALWLFVLFFFCSPHLSFLSGSFFSPLRPPFSAFVSAVPEEKFAQGAWKASATGSRRVGRPAKGPVCWPESQPTSRRAGRRTSRGPG